MKATTTCLIFAVSFLLFAVSGQCQDSTFHIYLAFGQSNMEGAGTIEAQDKVGTSQRFKVMGAVTCSGGGKSFTLGQWTNTLPPVVRCYTNLGPLDYFGRKMVASLPSDITVGVVPVAIGGSSIALFDKVNYAAYVATAPSWMADIIAQYGGNPYQRLVDMAKLAQKDGVIKGILFHQGETNTADPNWKKNVDQVVKNLKKDLGLGDVPFLAGELLSSMGACCVSHNVEVNKLPDLIPNAHVISSAGLVGADAAHFTPASYRTLGERYAQKMLELLAIDPPQVTWADEGELKNDIKIYPNPIVADSFTIQNAEKIKHVELYNIVGTKILSRDNTDQSSSIVIPVNGSAGMLFIKLSDGHKTVYKKKILIQ